MKETRKEQPLTLQKTSSSASEIALFTGSELPHHMDVNAGGNVQTEGPRFVANTQSVQEGTRE